MHGGVAVMLCARQLSLESVQSGISCCFLMCFPSLQKGSNVRLTPITGAERLTSAAGVSKAKVHRCMPMCDQPTSQVLAALRAQQESARQRCTDVRSRLDRAMQGINQISDRKREIDNLRAR